MPTLAVSDARFIADGREVVFRGAVDATFVRQQSTDYPVQGLTRFKREIDILKDMGANFVNIQWNSGFLDNPEYVAKLVGAITYAKSQRFWVELSLHSRGRDPKTNWDSIQITVADEQLMTDWSRLLGDPNVAGSIADNVDIYGILSEPDCGGAYQPDIWPQVRDIQEQVATMIRNGINNPNAVIAVSGIGCAGNPLPALDDPLTLQNGVLEIHPYQWTYASGGFEMVALTGRGKGLLSFVGEFGFCDPIDFTESQYKFFTANSVSYAVYWIELTTDNPCAIVNKLGTTERGRMAQKYFGLGGAP